MSSLYFRKWSSEFCKTPKINIHYTRTGGNKPPLILLHGLMGNGACWTPVAKQLAQEYDVIMPDARGHGKSCVPDKGYRYEDLANDVENFIEALTLPPPIIIGHSMGGMTAAVVAANNKILLKGLVLAEPTFLSPSLQREVYESDVAEQQRQFLRKPFDEVLAEACKKQPHRSVNTLKLINKARYETSLAPFQILKPPNPDYKKLVKEIEVKSLLVIADRGVVSPETAEELKGINSGLKVEMIKDAGHGLHYDQPEQFAAVVKSFLSDE